MSAWALCSLWRPRKQTRISLKSAKFEGKRVRCTRQHCRAPYPASVVQKVVMDSVTRALLLTELRRWRLDSVRVAWVTADVTNVALPVHGLATSDARCYPGQQLALPWFDAAAIGMPPAPVDRDLKSRELGAYSFFSFFLFFSWSCS